MPDIVISTGNDLISAKLRGTHLHVDLVAAEDDGDVLADTLEVTVPVGYVLVRDAGGDVEHDDTTLALDVVAIAETTKFLLTGGIPYVEADRAEVGGEGERVHFDTEGGCSDAVAQSSNQCTARGISRSATRLIHIPMYFFSNSPVKWRYEGMRYQHAIET